MRVTVLLLPLALAGLAVVEEGVTTVRVTVLDGRVPVVLFVAGLLMVFVFVREVVTVLVEAGLVTVLVEAGLVIVVVPFVTGTLVRAVEVEELTVLLSLVAGLTVELPVFAGCAEMLVVGLTLLLTSARAPVTIFPAVVGVVEVALLLLMLLEELPAPVVPATRLS